MVTINKTIARFELTTVYRHPEAKADIVLVHGLNGNPQKTWTAKNGVYWPADLLPTSLKNEHANVLVYGYNADVYSSKKDQSPSNNFVHHHAQNLVNSLTQYRKNEGTERHPIIWVAHSLGGIVLKRALLYSNDVRAHHQEDLRSIFVSTFGIIFLGTPHNGSNLAAWGRILQHMSDVVVPRRFFETEPVLLKTLKKDSETLQSINNHFLDIYQRFMIHMVHENHTTDIKGTKVFVVDTASANPQMVGVTYYGIEATHSGMCKFESGNAPGYLNVSTAIREWVALSLTVIPTRWNMEDEDRRTRANLEYFERMRSYNRVTLPTTEQQAIVQGSTSANNNEITSQEQPAPEVIEPVSPESMPEPLGQKLLEGPPPSAQPPAQYESQARQESQRPDEPLFIHPEPFRPNSYFIGREDELRGLHEMLMDRRRRSEGTSAVLIQCLPGGGKTHLARQYVFKHKDDYPGGVYWVRAKSRHEMEYWFWRIAKNEALKGLVEQRDVDELRDPKKIVEIVRKWLNTQSGWLMVFDGVQFDTPGLHEFIPDARNTSLIFTSTERAAGGEPQFDNPQVMELGLLTPQQAEDLLLMEMDKKQPWSADDRAKARELVQLMGRLPLMIHVAARHLRATREPLSKYLKSYRSRPKAGGLPAYRAVREQLEHRGANAALNLISLLVFFDQHIPVEMVSLGLSALDKTTPIKTCDVSHRKTNLNNTLRTLIAFALIERTESDDISPASSRSSKKSFDKHADYLDLLRIHSVVQAFFMDTLHEERQVDFWLERASAVWCRSYDEAHKRIQENPRVGLPDDYRRFSIHGQKLLQNLGRYEKRYPQILNRVRAEIETRLEQIQDHIDKLSETIQTNIINGSGEEPPSSVFDRSNSVSETDSAATMPSHDSETSWEPFFAADGESPGAFHSPILFDPQATTKPSDWRVPYPTKGLMPPVPDISGNDGEDEETVILPEQWQRTITNVDNDQIGGYEDWQEVIPHHRVVTRRSSRRYHDRAGAWRDTTVGDPRVGISQDLAVGSVSGRTAGSRSPSRARVTARSDAEMVLNKIKQTLPPLQGDSDGSPSSGGLSRPSTLLGRNSYAQVQAKKVPEAEFDVSPALFSSGLAQIISSPKSWTAATVKRLKENVLQSRGSVTSEPLPPTPAAVQEDELIVPPGPIFRGTRTANSSPASRSSPFPPPTFSALPEEADAEHHSHSQSDLPLAVRRWDTTVHHPGLNRLESSSGGIEWSTDPLSLSYPSILPHGQYQHSTQRDGLPQAPPIQIRHAPTGYSSQPMSYQSSHHDGIPAASPPLSTSSPPRRRPAFQHAAATHHSSPLAGSPEFLNTRLQPFPPPLHRRRPSYTETEPSPRMDPAFPEIDTSYQRYYQHQNPDPGASFPPPGATAHANAQRRIGRGAGRAASGMATRSQSPSPSPLSSGYSTTSGPSRPGQHQGSPDLLGWGGGLFGGSPAGGEPMVRDGSGGSSGGGSAGIRVGEGQMVEFGATGGGSGGGGGGGGGDRRGKGEFGLGISEEGMSP
ncbi:hypothetical protein B0H67DRAFT_126762 [Lasiosphaeris hirsuta]|uniref:DUF676 domain-containing protein n=1 Tax=Lasiosphaeris hirsuta TaxID=260670 RepID=A0AA40B099_9PEZI|nr:hypothetical protein B0H67DRAFT_126762 [Lasiosphaeris hirsuta]